MNLKLKNPKVKTIISCITITLSSLVVSVILTIALSFIISGSFGPYTKEWFSSNTSILSIIFSFFVTISQSHKRYESMIDNERIVNDLEGVCQELEKTNEEHKMCLIGCSLQIYEKLEQKHGNQIVDFIKNRIELSAQSIDKSADKIVELYSDIKIDNSNFLDNIKHIINLFFDKFKMTENDMRKVILSIVAGAIIGGVFASFSVENEWNQRAKMDAVLAKDIKIKLFIYREHSIDKSSPGYIKSKQTDASKQIYLNNSKWDYFYFYIFYVPMIAAILGLSCLLYLVLRKMNNFKYNI